MVGRVAFVLAALMSLQVHAGEGDKNLSPALRYMLFAREAGLSHCGPGSSRGCSEFDSVLAAVRLSEPLNSQSTARLEELGVRFPGDESRSASGTLSALVPLDNVRSIAALPFVRGLEARFPAPQPDFEENYPEFIEAGAAWNAMDEDGLTVTGHGVTIGVIDGWVDHLHPAFFRADAGYFAWLDVDEDGKFSPGNDAVDVNGDGVGDEGEILLLLKAVVAWHGHDGDHVENDGETYDVSMDWLWVDWTGDGTRNAGAGLGFGEDTPAYGEPLFIGDDVNGNGMLDLHEKVIRLGTSKIETIYLPYTGDSYVRGANLVDYPRSLDKASHATMTVGLLAANDPSRQRLHGIAADADIVLADIETGFGQAYDPENTGSAYLEGLLWLADHGAQVVMHEYGSPFFEFGDGSSSLETAIDTVLEEKGVVSCTATHNFAGYNMHGIATAPAGGEVAFDIELSVYPEWYPTETFYGTIRWREPLAGIVMTLKSPEGKSWEMGEGGFEPAGEAPYMWYSGHDQSPRNTRMASFALYNSYMGDQFLASGHYTLTVQNSTDQDQEVDLFVGDQYGYLVTGTLNSHTTKKGTMAHPSTADSAISAGAFRANVDSWYDEIPQGELTFYSGQGPRIDGEIGLDVVGPSDGLAPWHEPLWHYPLFSYASGTSGSLPQVTGVVALMIQAVPELVPGEIKQRLWDNSVADDFTGALPNNQWGYGRLSAYRAVFGEPPWPNKAPVIALEFEAAVRKDQSFVLDASGSHDPDGTGEPLSLRWDVGYDGSWDWDFSPEMSLLLGPVPEPGLFQVLVEARDARGARALRLVNIQVLDEVWTPPEPEPQPEPVPDLVTSQDVGPEVALDAAADTVESAGEELSSAGCGCRTATRPGIPSGALALLCLMFVGLVVRRLTAAA